MHRRLRLARRPPRWIAVARGPATRLAPRVKLQCSDSPNRAIALPGIDVRGHYASRGKNPRQLSTQHLTYSGRARAPWLLLIQASRITQRLPRSGGRLSLRLDPHGRTGPALASPASSPGFERRTYGRTDTDTGVPLRRMPTLWRATGRDWRGGFSSRAHGPRPRAAMREAGLLAIMPQKRGEVEGATHRTTDQAQARGCV